MEKTWPTRFITELRDVIDDYVEWAKEHGADDITLPVEWFEHLLPPLQRLIVLFEKSEKMLSDEPS